MKQACAKLRGWRNARPMPCSPLALTKNEVGHARFSVTFGKRLGDRQRMAPPERLTWTARAALGWLSCLRRMDLASSSRRGTVWWVEEA